MLFRQNILHGVSAGVVTSVDPLGGTGVEPSTKSAGNGSTMS